MEILLPGKQKQNLSALALSIILKGLLKATTFVDYAFISVVSVTLQSHKMIRAEKLLTADSKWGSKCQP